MGYIPQFIPTDIKALQGVMDQHQAKWDYNTQRQDELGDVVASMDATRPYDLQKKQEFSDKLKEALSVLDKEYNFDRSSSQYSKALSSKIMEFKSDPYWSFKKAADKVDEQRRTLINTRGAMYHENVNPFDPKFQLSEKNMSPLTEWRPYDRKDFIIAGAQAGKGLALDIKRKNFSYPIPGLVEFEDGVGFEDTKSLINYLNQNEDGKSRVNQVMMSLGADTNDPILRQTVIESMAANGVGSNQYERRAIPGWGDSSSGNKTDAPPQLVETGSILETEPYGITSVQDAFNKGKELETKNAQISSMPDGPAKNVAQREAMNLQNELDRYRNLLQQKVNSPSGKVSLQTGLDVVKKQWGLKDTDAPAKYQELMEYMVTTTAFQRSDVVGMMGPAVEGLGYMAQQAGNLVGIINDAVEYYDPFRNPAYTNPLNSEAMAERILPKVKAMAETWNNANDSEYENNSMISKALQEATKRVQEEMKNPDYEVEYKNLSPSELETKIYMRFRDEYFKINEFREWFKGRGKYSEHGYDQISEPIKADLKAGEKYASRVVNFMPNVKDPEQKPYFEFAVKAAKHFDVYDMSDKKLDMNGVPLTGRKAQNVVDDFVDGKYLAGSFVFNREGAPSILLTASNGTEYKLQMGDKMPDDVAIAYAKILQREEFLDQLVSHVKFSDREYTINDKDGYLRWVLDAELGIKDPTPYIGMVAKRQTINNEVKYTIDHPDYRNPNPDSGGVYTFKSKQAFLNGLAWIAEQKKKGK